MKLFEALMKYNTEEQWVNDCNAAGVGEEAQVLLKYWGDMAWGTIVRNRLLAVLPERLAPSSSW